MKLYKSLKQILEVINYTCRNNNAEATVSVRYYYLDSYFNETSQYAANDIAQFRTNGYLNIVTVYEKLIKADPAIKTDCKWYSVMAEFNRNVRIGWDYLPERVFDSEGYMWMSRNDYFGRPSLNEAILRRGDLAEYTDVLC